MQLGNFREDAKHRETRFTHETYLEDTADTPALRSVLFSVPGARHDRFLHDSCHGQLLGTGKVCNGSCLVYLLERGFFGSFPARGQYGPNLQVLLRKAYSVFRPWQRDNNFQRTQPRFTPARLHRTGRHCYPCLSSKAHPSKVLTFWLTAMADRQAKKEDATPLDKQIHICMYGYARSLQIMDQHGLILPPEAAKEFYDVTMLHLRVYADLREQSSRVQGKELNRSLWVLLTKHHHMMHVAEDTLNTHTNPRIYSLLCAESFVGSIGRISRACHRANVSTRVAQRYLACLHFEATKAKKWMGGRL